MSLSQYLLGAAELVVIVSALGYGAYHARALLVPGWAGAVARLAEIVLGLSALVVIAELLGVVGLLEELPLVLACVIAGLATALLARRRSPAPAPEAPAPSPGWPMFAIAVAASAVVVAHWAMPTQESLNTGMYYQDTTWYHMSFSGRFAQEGDVGPLHFTDPLKLAVWYYPQNSELLHAVGIVALDNDFLSPLINLGWLALALLGAWCVGRPYAVGAGTLAAAILVMDSEMIVGSQAGNAPNDIMGLFFLLAMMAFLVTGASQYDPDGEGRAGPIAGIGTGPLLLAGLAAGLGIGTKITLLAAVGFLTLGLLVLAGRKSWWRAAALFLGGMFVTAGFWYVRALVYAANPFPQLDEIAGIDIPGPQQLALYPRSPHSLHEYYNDPGVWVDWFFPILDERLGPLWFLVLAAVVAGLVAALLWGGTNLIRLLALTGIIAGIAYIFTPLTASGALGEPSGFEANLRYVAPPVIIGLVLIPLIPAMRRGRWPWIVLGGLLALTTIQALRPLSDGLFDLARSWDFEHLGGAIVLAVAIVGVPVALALLARRGVPGLALVALPVLTVALLVAIGRPHQEDYLRDRYETALAPPLEGGFRSLPEWKALQQWGKEIRGERIAVVGRAAGFGQYVFYGDDLTNHVQYVGRELNRGTLRPVRTCAEWRQKLNEGGYTYLVTTPRFLQDEDQAPLENEWTGTDEDAVEVVVRSGPARVYRIDGPFSPWLCREQVETFKG